MAGPSGTTRARGGRGWPAGAARATRVLQSRAACAIFHDPNPSPDWRRRLAATPGFRRDHLDPARRSGPDRRAAGRLADPADRPSDAGTVLATTEGRDAMSSSNSELAGRSVRGRRADPAGGVRRPGDLHPAVEAVPMPTSPPARSSCPASSAWSASANYFRPGRPLEPRRTSHAAGPEEHGEGRAPAEAEHHGPPLTWEGRGRLGQPGGRAPAAGTSARPALVAPAGRRTSTTSARSCS